MPSTPFYFVGSHIIRCQLEELGGDIGRLARIRAVELHGMSLVDEFALVVDKEPAWKEKMNNHYRRLLKRLSRDGAVIVATGTMPEPFTEEGIVVVKNEDGWWYYRGNRCPGCGCRLGELKDIGREEPFLGQHSCDHAVRPDWIDTYHLGPFKWVHRLRAAVGGYRSWAVYPAASGRVEIVYDWEVVGEMEADPSLGKAKLVEGAVLTVKRLHRVMLENMEGPMKRIPKKAVAFLGG